GRRVRRAEVDRQPPRRRAGRRLAADRLVGHGGGILSGHRCTCSSVASSSYERANTAATDRYDGLAEPSLPVARQRPAALTASARASSLPVPGGAPRRSSASPSCTSRRTSSAST